MWQLDDPAQRQLVQADFQLSSASPGTLLIDEWQHLPQVWDSVRRQVDDGAQPGRFLLTGSATPVDAAGTHSGAGRILSLRMRPMALHERGLITPTVSLADLLNGTAGEINGQSHFTLHDYITEITRSGLPGVMNTSNRVRNQMLDAYLQRIIDRDLPDRGFDVRKPEMLSRWLAAYAAATSTTTMYSKLLDAATGTDGQQPAKTTTLEYREQLTRLWLLDPVPGWLPTNNPIRRLQKAPKHQLADPALAARLLRLSASKLVSEAGAHMLGPLFEALVVLGVRVAAQAAEAEVSHLRLREGKREIDLIVEGPEGQVLAIEVKLSGTVNDADVRHLLWLRDLMPDRVVDVAVVNTGPGAYRRPDGVAVIPLALFGA